MDAHDDPRCTCGALLDHDHAALCRKCTARVRWQRRHAGRRGHTNPDGRGGDHG